jgi:hypothetical protein
LGVANSKKSFLKSKVFLLVMSLVCTGLILKYFGPDGKLDGRYFYTSLEGISYLESLSEHQMFNYLCGEILDFWFMVNYSWLFYLFVPKKIVFLPGLLDFLETSLIVIYLVVGQTFSLLHILPFLSVPKWFLAVGTGLYVTRKALQGMAKK